MEHQNHLGFNKIKVYSLKKDKYKFVFIFAENEKQASEHFQKIFTAAPKNCYEYSLDVDMLRGKQVISIRELRKEHYKFPAMAFIYQKPSCYVDE